VGSGVGSGVGVGASVTATVGSGVGAGFVFPQAQRIKIRQRLSIRANVLFMAASFIKKKSIVC
jgi:hypothetical protein